MKKFVPLIVLLIISLGCKTVQPGQITDGGISKELYPGYTLFDMPNTGDKPGTIFRITKSGQRFYVTRLRVSVQLDSTLIKESIGKRNSSFGLLVNFLGLTNLPLTANDTLNRTKNVNYGFSFGGTPIREYVGDLDFSAEYKKVKQEIINDITENNRFNDKYYVVRETIKCTEYKFSFGKALTLNQDFNAALAKLASLGSGYHVDKGDSLRLSFKGSSPYRVFFVPEKLTLTNGSNGVQDLQITKVDEKEFAY